MTEEPWSRHWFVFATAPPRSGAHADLHVELVRVLDVRAEWASSAGMTAVTLESHRSPCPPGIDERDVPE